MRIAIIASPFISVPPHKYGGTELFIAQLAEGLTRLGLDVVVYANGESTVDAELRWLYPEGEWPITGELYSNLKDLNHTAWALRDCWKDADVVHLNNAPGLAFTRFGGPAVVYTIHHPNLSTLNDFYRQYPNVEYVTISRAQLPPDLLPRMRTIHHGVDLDCYNFNPNKREYFAFLGRIAPVKGTHIAIEIAKKAGIPLKIAGEIQPMFREYWEKQILPHVDGRFIEYVGEADLAIKNELLGNAMALLFPIQWHEPFGLVMVEAMACGTPVLAFSGGAVGEVVCDHVSGYICRNVNDVVARAKDLKKLKPANIRSYVQQRFSVEQMVRQYCTLYSSVVGAVEKQITGEPEGPRAVA
ncbi:MAG TPA: glycosyltransferase family 4 protein [candidate division Zixibacteria bacterium]|nr:glycosyltransferase family 4 protein [candidate division Zixibacteria bacterium]